MPRQRRLSPEFSARHGLTCESPPVEALAGSIHLSCWRAPCAAKVTPIRFFWIQIIWHSWTVESFAITSLKLGGTKAGFSTSMAAPWGEIFRIMQLMTEPPDDT